VSCRHVAYEPIAVAVNDFTSGPDVGKHALRAEVSWVPLTPNVEDVAATTPWLFGLGNSGTPWARTHESAAGLMFPMKLVDPGPPFTLEMGGASAAARRRCPKAAGAAALAAGVTFEAPAPVAAAEVMPRADPAMMRPASAEPTAILRREFRRRPSSGSPQFSSSSFCMIFFFFLVGDFPPCPGCTKQAATGPQRRLLPSCYPGLRTLIAMGAALVIGPRDIRPELPMAPDGDSLIRKAEGRERTTDP
jgi:hypothetical protein